MIVKVLTSPSKLRNEEHRNYFTDILHIMVMNVNRLNNYKIGHKTKNGHTPKLFHRHYIQDNHEDNSIK